VKKLATSVETQSPMTRLKRPKSIPLMTSPTKTRNQNFQIVFESCLEGSPHLLRA